MYANTDVNGAKGKSVLLGPIMKKEEKKKKKKKNSQKNEMKKGKQHYLSFKIHTTLKRLNMHLISINSI